MATRRTAAAAPKYQDDVLYQVQLTRPVPVPGGRYLLPIHSHKVKGRFLATLDADAVSEAVAVTAPAAD